MVISLEKNANLKLDILDSKNPVQIKYALNKLLFCPEVQLKSKIVNILVKYLKNKLSEKDYPIKVFIAKLNNRIEGFVVSQIDPNYRTYGRKAGTFGWLLATSEKICNELMLKCEEFVKKYGMRKIRGPINLPKMIGGIGLQVEGFDSPMINGISFNKPNDPILEYLQNMGYKIESTYLCVHVTKEFWKKSKELSSDYEFGYLSVNELLKRKPELINLARESLLSILADAIGGSERFDEMVEIYSKITSVQLHSNSVQLNDCLHDELNYLKSLIRVNKDEVNPWVPLAFEKETNQIVGIILCLPNLYQLWSGKPLTHGNVDTVIIKKEHSGKGIFSALNNIGQVILKSMGVNYFEGTTIWGNNTRAIETIFPHSKIVRKHVVFQKRL